MHSKWYIYEHHTYNLKSKKCTENKLKTNFKSQKRKVTDLKIIINTYYYFNIKTIIST